MKEQYKSKLEKEYIIEILLEILQQIPKSQMDMGSVEESPIESR
jgi:hypothetical protein